ncbi:MAG: LytR C-terminal domain-containing protein [Thermoleophilaceae bacterium]
MPEIVQEIGSYAGIASVVGVALLAALYFSQARDVKRLREWAGRAPERADQQQPAVPGRVVAQPQAKPAPSASGAPPVPAQAVATGARPPAATPAAASGSAAAARPVPPKPGAPATPAPATAGAPAGSTPANAPAAPAKAPAVPAKGPSVPGTAPPVPAPSGQPVPAGVGAQASAQAPAKPAAPVPAGANSGAPAPLKPGVAAPGQNASAPARTGGPATAAAKRPAEAGPSGGQPGQPSQATAIIPPPDEEPWYRRLAARPRYLVLVVAGVLILGSAVAFGVAQLAKDDDGGASTPASAPADNEQSQSDEAQDEEAAKPKKGAPIEPSSVTVAVLNGTTVGGLAAALGDQVGAAGFQVGTVANFGPNQQLAESIVEYTKGHEREAAAVGRKLGISQRERARAESQELAGDATVIVIAGADQAP